MSLDETRALARVMAGKQVALLKRYWVNTVSNLLSSYIMFALLFFGGSAVAPATIRNTLVGIIVGFFLWSMSWAAFTGPATSLTEEAQWGTLEQLYMSPLGLRRVLALDIVVSLLVSFTTSAVFLAMMMVTAGRYLRVNVVTVLPLVALTMCSALGLGFAFGGLALIYKRISNSFLLVQFLFLGSLAAPPGLVFWALPLSLGNDLLRAAMGKGRPLWALPPELLVGLVVKAAVYLVVGGLLFGLAVRKAKRHGVMGHY